VVVKETVFEQSDGNQRAGDAGEARGAAAVFEETLVGILAEDGNAAEDGMSLG